MPKYLVTLYYAASIDKEVEADSYDEAQEKAEREGEPREDMAYDWLAFDKAVVQGEIHPEVSEPRVESEDPVKTALETLLVVARAQITDLSISHEDKEELEGNITHALRVFGESR